MQNGSYSHERKQIKAMEHGLGISFMLLKKAFQDTDPHFFRKKKLIVTTWIWELFLRSVLMIEYS